MHNSTSANTAKKSKPKFKREKATINNPFTTKWKVIDRQRSLAVLESLGTLFSVAVIAAPDAPETSSSEQAHGGRKKKKKTKSKRSARKLIQSDMVKWKVCVSLCMCVMK